MAIDTTTPRTRRAIVGGAAGAVAASVVGALARPLPASATQQSVYVLNDENMADVIWARSVTQNRHQNSGKGTAVHGHSDHGLGVYGASDQGTGVYGLSGTGPGVHAESSNGPGVHAISEVNFGVRAESTSTHAIFATSPSNAGVFGASTSGPGLYGHSWSNYGVYGSTTNGVGVLGVSTNGRGGVFVGKKAPIRLTPSGSPTHPVSGAMGDLYVDSAGRLWFCTKGGNPGTWKQVSLV